MKRFWDKVEKTDTCWLWNGSIASGGYGQFRFQGRMTLVHRWAYEVTIGPIPDGLQLDHLCRVRHCVNPSHLEPVTCKENLSRGNLNLWQKIKTTCPAGHEYSSTNTFRTSQNGRGCRKCHAAHQREYMQRKELRK